MKKMLLGKSRWTNKHGRSASHCAFDNLACWRCGVALSEKTHFNTPREKSSTGLCWGCSLKARIKCPVCKKKFSTHYAKHKHFSSLTRTEWKTVVEAAEFPDK